MHKCDGCGQKCLCDGEEYDWYAAPVDCQCDHRPIEDYDKEMADIRVCSHGKTSPCDRCELAAMLALRKELDPDAYTAPLDDYITLLERNNRRLREVLKDALEQTGCDGDLCNYRWHEKARVLLGE